MVIPRWCSSLSLVCAVALAACGSTPPPAGGAPGGGAEVGPGAPAGSGAAADGAACAAAADCESGVCEGQGCGDVAGVCVPRDRACTMDLREYCGCDGVTFASSGSCPGRRYAAEGACEAAVTPPAASPGAEGAACRSGAECASGVCEGQGCGDDAPGTCAPAQRACTKDLREYCGCDGVTFRGSGSCPGRRFASRGRCPG